MSITLAFRVQEIFESLVVVGALQSHDNGVIFDSYAQ